MHIVAGDTGLQACKEAALVVLVLAEALLPATTLTPRSDAVGQLVLEVELVAESSVPEGADVLRVGLVLGNVVERVERVERSLVGGHLGRLGTVGVLDDLEVALVEVADDGHDQLLGHDLEVLGCHVRERVLLHGLLDLLLEVLELKTVLGLAGPRGRWIVQRLAVAGVLLWPAGLVQALEPLDIMAHLDLEVDLVADIAVEVVDHLRELDTHVAGIVGGRVLVADGELGHTLVGDRVCRHGEHPHTERCAGVLGLEHVPDALLYCGGVGHHGPGVEDVIHGGVGKGLPLLVDRDTGRAGCHLC